MCNQVLDPVSSHERNEEQAMRIPMQSRPVQRSVPGQPFAGRDAGAIREAEQGLRPSESGVQPSGWVDDVVKIAGVAGPLLGSFGI
jgi:hypothetical protein